MINKSLKYIFAKAGYIICTPYGDIYLTSSLVERCLGSTRLLIGICAHEMTHYICKHSLIELWQNRQSTIYIDCRCITLLSIQVFPFTGN